LDKEIWVLAEHHGGGIEDTTFEVLSVARTIADKLEAKVLALLLGHEVNHLARSLGHNGADKIYLIDNPQLQHYTTDGYAFAITELVRNRMPSILLMSATALGRDIAPKLAVRLKTSLVSDCTILEVNDQGVLEMIRATYGGRVYAAITCPSSRPQIATVRPGIIEVGAPKEDKEIYVERIDIGLKPELIRTKVLGTSRVDPANLDISEAEFVVATGRGLGKGSKITQMEELSKLLGASLGGSRAAVDAGWVSFERQIGQTGKTISPKIIICLGIFGATQFTMGMSDARFIVAINNDRRAPIFKVADVGVLGDLHRIVPLLIQRLRAMAGVGTQGQKNDG